MVIYKIISDYKDIKANTKFTFNKSRQRFETFSRKHFITNDQSYHNPGLIVIHKTLTRKSENKRIIIIPFWCYITFVTGSITVIRYPLGYEFMVQLHTGYNSAKIIYWPIQWRKKK